MLNIFEVFMPFDDYTFKNIVDESSNSLKDFVPRGINIDEVSLKDTVVPMGIYFVLNALTGFIPYMSFTLLLGLSATYGTGLVDSEDKLNQIGTKLKELYNNTDQLNNDKTGRLHGIFYDTYVESPISNSQRMARLASIAFAAITATSALTAVATAILVDAAARIELKADLRSALTSSPANSGRDSATCGF
jgi:hypothetical protein